MSFPDTAFLDMLDFRWLPDNGSCDEVSCLKSVRLDIIGRRFTPQLLDPLGYLVAGGMKIELCDSAGLLSL